MSGIDDLNFEDLVDGAINTIDDAKTERIEAKLIQPKARKAAARAIVKKAAAKSAGHASGGDDTIEMLDATARMGEIKPPDIPGKDPGGAASFDHIYTRSGVEAGEFTVFRLEELFNDEDLASLDQNGRVAAVRAILKSHDVDLGLIVEDAVARRTALDSHDQRLKSNIQRVEREMEKENTNLQNEIEEYANPRIERMERNNERVERLRRDYAEWFGRKRAEHDRIVDILAPWGGDERLMVADEANTLPSPTAPTPSVSRDEAFEPQPVVEAPKPVDHSVLEAAGAADQWAFDEEPTIEPDAPSRAEREPANDLAPAEMTDDFEFQQPKFRPPRTIVQWTFTLLTLAVSLVMAVLLAAQLSMIQAEGAIFLGLAAAPVLALVPSFISRHRSDFWSGWVVWWMVFAIAGVGIAHMDPANLTKNLTKRPLWFIDEAGLNAEVEEAVHTVTRPYAEAMAPLLGAQDAIWNPPTTEAPDAAPSE